MNLTRNSWLGSASLHILANYYLAVYCGVMHTTKHRRLKIKYIYSHSYSVTNIGAMISCLVGAVLVSNEYYRNQQLWVLAIAIILVGLTLFSIDLIITKVSIYADNKFLYISPCQPITFKKSFKFKRSEIKGTKVKTSKEVTRYGIIVTHQVVLITKNSKSHVILMPRNKVEALRIKKEVSKFRYA
jgi:hypothetical protein